MKGERIIYVLLPVKATIYEGKVVATEPPTIKQVGDACDKTGFWDDKVGAETAIKYGLAASPPRLDKVIRETSFSLVADQIDQAAQRWETSHETSWGPAGKKPDPHMVDVGKTDAADLRQVAAFVREGKFKEARDSASHLDTIVRDELPSSFFNLLKEKDVRW